MDELAVVRVIFKLLDGLREIDMLEKMIIMFRFEENIFFPASLQMLFDLAPADIHSKGLVLALDELRFGWLMFIHNLINYKIKNFQSFKMVMAQISLH